MTSKTKNIIIVDNSVAITGALKAIVNATLLLKNNFQFIFVLPRDTSAHSFITNQGFQLYTLPFIEISKDPKNLLLYGFYLIFNGYKLKNIAQKHQVAIIHMNDFYNLTGLMAKFLGAKVKLITHVRFLPQKFTPVLAKFWAHLNLRFADKIICVSEAVKSFFPQAHKIRVVPDPIPEQEKYPVKHIDYSSPEKEVHLLYLSNYIRGKGQQYALLAFKNAFNSNNKLRLTFAGGDMDLAKNRLFKQELEQTTREYGLEGVVRFKSFVQDIEKAIKDADILLNFSESESFSLTCLDALFYGTPLIASDCGGPAELFENNKSGILVPNKDVNAMTQAIIHLAGDKNIQRKFAENGKMFVRNKFSAKNSYLKLQDIYNKLLQ